MGFKVSGVGSWVVKGGCQDMAGKLGSIEECGKGVLDGCVGNILEIS